MYRNYEALQGVEITETFQIGLDMKYQQRLAF